MNSPVESFPLQTVSPRAEIGLKEIQSILRRRFWIVVVLMVASLCVAQVVLQHIPRKWRAEAQMVLLQHIPSQGGAAKPDYSGPLVETVDTQVGMIQSNSMAQRAWDWVQNDPVSKAQLPPGGIDEDALQTIAVTTPRDSQLMNVSVDARSPTEAAVLANAVCQAYVQWKKDIARKDIQGAADSLGGQAAQAKAQMLAAEQKQLAYQQAHHIVDAPTQERAMIDQLQARNADVAGLEQQLASETARLQALDAQLQSVNKAIRSGTAVRDDGLVISLQAELSQAEVDRSETAAKFTSAFPGMLGPADAKIADIKKRLSKAIQGTVDNTNPSLQAQGTTSQEYNEERITEVFTRAKLAAATRLRDQVQAQLAGMPQSGMESAQLERAAALAAAQYTSIQAAANSAQLDLEKITGDVQITQEATVPSQPFQPKPRLVLAIGAVAGALLSLLSILLLEQIDTRLHGVEDMRVVSGLPIIGLLPRLSRAQRRRLSDEGVLPQVREAVSPARVNLLAFLGDRQRRDGATVILVTSAIPQEGKSLVAAQLARSCAYAGKRVILVDAHLRRPAQRQLFRAKAGAGLAELLSGQRELDEVIASSGVARLSLLQSGGRSESPTDLLSQPELAAILKSLRGKADIVIVDAPDCTSVADAHLLAPDADGILMVARAGRVPASSLRDAVMSLGSSGVPMCLFINGLDRSEQRAYRNRCVFRAAPVPLTDALQLGMDPKLPEVGWPDAPASRHRDAPVSMASHRPDLIGNGTIPVVLGTPMGHKAE